MSALWQERERHKVTRRRPGKKNKCTSMRRCSSRSAAVPHRNTLSQWAARGNGQLEGSDVAQERQRAAAGDAIEDVVVEEG